jgi:hypothetical protein
MIKNVEMIYSSQPLSEEIQALNDEMGSYAQSNKKYSTN